MKLMKRTLCFLLTATMLFANTFIVFADDSVSEDDINILETKQPEENGPIVDEMILTTQADTPDEATEDITNDIGDAPEDSQSEIENETPEETVVENPQDIDVDIDPNAVDSVEEEPKEELSENTDENVQPTEDALVIEELENSTEIGENALIEEGFMIQMETPDRTSLTNSANTDVLVSSISMQSSIEGTIGRSCVLKATISPSDAKNKHLIWTSSDTNVATVSRTTTYTTNASNNIKIVGPGEAVITVASEDGGATAECRVTVGAIAVSSVRVSRTSLILDLGSEDKKEYQLTASVNPSNAGNKEVTWTSNNESVATVSSDGNVVARSAGSATITAKTVDGNKTATCRVTVKQTGAVTQMYLSPASASKSVGETVKVKATLNRDAIDTQIKWTTSNASVATIESETTYTGDYNVVTIVGEGEAIITATSGGVSKTCRIRAQLIHPTSIKMSISKKVMKKGSSYTLRASVSPTKANKNVTWTSSNEKVVTVDAGGKVTAVGPGTATITAKTVDGGKTATCEITVSDTKIGSITINKSTLSLPVGKTEQLKANIRPVSADNISVKWASSDPSIATVDQNGLVKTIKEGKTKITATAQDGSGKAGTCNLTVANIKISSLKLNKSAANIKVGKTTTIRANIMPLNASNKGLAWTSSDNKIATVNENGKVTGVKAGTATITAAAKDGSGKKATCKITVAEVKVKSVQLNKSSMNVSVGSTKTLKATVNPTGATNQAVTWSSSDKSVATVDKNGVVKGVKKGKATITVKTKDGGKTATCKVTVK